MRISTEWLTPFLYNKPKMKQKLLFKPLFTVGVLLMTVASMQAQEPYAVLSDDGNTATFYYDSQKET